MQLSYATVRRIIERYERSGHIIDNAAESEVRRMTDPTIREMLDDVVAALNKLVTATVCQADVTLPPWMQEAVLHADLLVNQIQDAFEWVKDPDDEAYWPPPKEHP